MRNVGSNLLIQFTAKVFAGIIRLVLQGFGRRDSVVSAKKVQGKVNN